MRDAFHADKPQKSILVGDLNIAPREDDVWDHKKLLKVVSHTPVEVEALGRRASLWRLDRRHPRQHPRRQTLQLVVLPRRRLGHRRQRTQARPRLGHLRHRRLRPLQPRGAARARLGKTKRPRAGVCDV